MKYETSLREKVENYLDKCRQILFSKRVEYNTKDDDVFNNVDVVARTLGCSREEHLLHLKMKHTATILHYIERLNDPDISTHQFKEIANRLIDKKLVDDINYSVLIGIAVRKKLEGTIQEEEHSVPEDFSWSKVGLDNINKTPNH